MPGKQTGAGAAGARPSTAVPGSGLAVGGGGGPRGRRLSALLGCLAIRTVARHGRQREVEAAAAGRERTEKKQGQKGAGAGAKCWKVSVCCQGSRQRCSAQRNETPNTRAAPIGGVETFLHSGHRLPGLWIEKLGASRLSQGELSINLAAVALDEGQTRCAVLDQIGVKAFTHLALHVCEHILLHHRFYLLWCESALESKASFRIKRASHLQAIEKWRLVMIADFWGTQLRMTYSQLSIEVRHDMLHGTMHTLANILEIHKNRLFRTFPGNLNSRVSSNPVQTTSPQLTWGGIIVNFFPPMSSGFFSERAS